MGALARFERPERDRRNAHAGSVRLAEPAVLERGALGLLDGILESGQRALPGGLGERLRRRPSAR